MERPVLEAQRLWVACALARTQFIDGRGEARNVRAPHGHDRSGKVVGIARVRPLGRVGLHVVLGRDARAQYEFWMHNMHFAMEDLLLFQVDGYHALAEPATWHGGSIDRMRGWFQRALGLHDVFAALGGQEGAAPPQFSVTVLPRFLESGCPSRLLLPARQHKVQTRGMGWSTLEQIWPGIRQALARSAGPAPEPERFEPEREALMLADYLREADLHDAMRWVEKLQGYHDSMVCARTLEPSGKFDKAFVITIKSNR